MPKLRESARRALVEERQKQIISAAAKVFARKGYERATIADIAREAGLAEGSIYNYFKNKSDLLIQLPRQMILPGLEQLTGQMLAPGEDGMIAPPEAALTHISRQVVSTIRQNAGIFRILLSALPSMKQSARQKYLESVVLSATALLEAYFREQIDRGTFRRDLDPAIAARTYIGMFFPFILLHDVLQVQDPQAIEIDVMVEQNVRIFLRGALVAGDRRESK